MRHKGYGHSPLEQLLDEGFDNLPVQGHTEATLSSELHSIVAEVEFAEGGGGIVGEHAIVHIGKDGVVEGAQLEEGGDGRIEEVDDFVVNVPAVGDGMGAKRTAAVEDGDGIGGWVGGMVGGRWVLRGWWLRYWRRRCKRDEVEEVKDKYKTG